MHGFDKIQHLSPTFFFVVTLQHIENPSVFFFSTPLLNGAVLKISQTAPEKLTAEHMAFLLLYNITAINKILLSSNELILIQENIHLQGEISTIEGVHAASRCCKE
jgi:hypothetical protein